MRCPCEFSTLFASAVCAADAVNMADSEAMLDSGTLGALEDLRAASDVLEEEWRPGSSITTWKRVKLESEIDVVEL